MGSLFLFRCPACGYQAEVSGGLDFGMICATHTVSCPRCKELSDVTVSENPGEVMDWTDVELDEDENSTETASQAEWMPDRIRCGLDGRHKAQLWSHPGPCPCCGTSLLMGEQTLWWD